MDQFGHISRFSWYRYDPIGCCKRMTREALLGLGGESGTAGRAKASEESGNTCEASLRSTIEKIVSCDRTICKFGLRGLTDVRLWPHFRDNFRLLKICYHVQAVRHAASIEDCARSFRLYSIVAIFFSSYD